MYARPLFVVVGIFRAFSSEADPGPDRAAAAASPNRAGTGSISPPFSLSSHLVLQARLGMSGGCGYTLAIMNDAIKPGPETPSQAGLPELSVVVPTFNERDNVTVLYRRLEATLAGIAWEVVFVDDNSPDGTWEVVRGLARKDSRVRCIRRIGRRGVSGACLEGILASSAAYAAVIDADLQHDETQLPKMLSLLAGGQADPGVGARTTTATTSK